MTTLSDDITADLIRDAERYHPHDEPDVENVRFTDYAGDTIEDAYHYGTEHGAIMIARAILDKLGIPYTPKNPYSTEASHD